MKKGAVPQLLYSWWDQNKGKTVPKTGLGAALKAYEKAAGQVNDNCRTDVMETVIARLDEVAKVAKKAIGLCNKKLHAETIEALGRFDDVIAKYRDPLQKRIKKIEGAVAQIDAKSKEHIPKLQPKWKEFVAVLQSLRDAVAAAEEELDPAKFGEWEALAGGAEAACQQKFAEVQSWLAEINVLITAAPVNVRTAYAAENNQATKRFGGTLVAMDEKMGGELKDLVKDLKKLVKDGRVLEAEGLKLSKTLAAAIKDIEKVADEEDDLLRQLVYKLENFKSTSAILRKAQALYGSQLDALKNRREKLKAAVLPSRERIPELPGEKALTRLFNDFQAINSRIGEGNAGVEKQIRDVLTKDYEVMAKMLEKQEKKK